MTAESPPQAAQRLWARASHASTTPAEVSAAAERLCTALRGELGRWIGVDGFRALVDRSLVLSRPEHPALDTVPCLVTNETEAAVPEQTHSAAQMAAGMVALLSALIELLGRIIGDEMATHLVGQIEVPGAHAAASARSKEERNG